MTPWGAEACAACSSPGTAGFIGYHLARLLLAEGFHVHGYDGMTDYYDVRLKRRRHQMLLQHPNFAATEGLLEDQALLRAGRGSLPPDVIVHLAAQAGVRYSLENPRAYLDANVIGTFNVMEVARLLKVRHLLMASTSSVYGANAEMPFTEMQKADTQLTIYAATKKATESMGHAYAHLWNLPTTMFRFFTVYGPWGRPDMAYFKFAEEISEDRPIDLYNRGDLYRDFTYVDDLVRGIRLLIDCVPREPESAGGSDRRRQSFTGCALSHREHRELDEGPPARSRGGPRGGPGAEGEAQSPSDAAGRCGGNLG